jgi:hypothetical protein
MKRFHAISAIAVLTTVAVVAAVGADAPSSRPPGVSANDWAPINDTLGVVLDQTASAAGDPLSPVPPPSAGQTDRLGHVDGLASGSLGGAILIPPISGYLMVKRGHQWQRVILVEPVKGPGVAG